MEVVRMPTKIYVVRDMLTGGIAKAFRNQQKADDYREFLDPSIQRPVHAVDEVELDDEVPKPEAGSPHSVRMTINVSVHARVGEFLGADEQLEGSGAAQAQKWAIVQIARALGDSFQEFEHMAVEVLDEQNRRVDG
jgi:hypothetical protein